jgi:hypothetical protein
MARAIDWTHYGELKGRGLGDREIARQWEIPWSTFHREKQKRGALNEGMSLKTPRVPDQTPGVSKRVPHKVSEGVPVEVLAPLPPTASPSDMTPLLHDILQELRTLTQGLAGRVSTQTPEAPSPTPGVSRRVPHRVPLGPREKTERWNLHLPIDLITKTKAKAQALGVHPSELVGEILRRWLAEEHI